MGWNIPFLKCINCSKNQGQTQIKIHSSCFSKPIIINFDCNDNKQIEAVERILHRLFEGKMAINEV